MTYRIDFELNLLSNMVARFLIQSSRESRELRQMGASRILDGPLA